LPIQFQTERNVYESLELVNEFFRINDLPQTIEVMKEFLKNPNEIDLKVPLQLPDMTRFKY
jgi:hypothetical protein